MSIIGNDIVDLAQSPKDKHLQTRYLNRVFTKLEQELITDNISLWAFWAAKETAFKIIAKLIPNPQFIYKNFIIVDFIYQNQTFDHPSKDKTSERDQTNEPVLALATIKYKTFLIKIKIFINITRKYIHAVGVYPNFAADSNFFFGTAKIPNSTNPSQIARDYLKQAIARHCNLPVCQLQIIRPTHNDRMQPPYLLVNNLRSAIDVSISHHEGWISWGFTADFLSLTNSL